MASMLLAAAVYPGGSWTDREATGFSLLRNFWCDLLRAQAINGADNTWGKLFASIGFAALGIGLWPYWWLAAAPLGGRQRRVALCGIFSAACLAAMAYLPSDEQPVLHGVVALGGALTGSIAALICVATRLPGEARLSLRRASGALALSLAALNAALYIYVAYAGGGETLAQPLVQKLATLALLVWMLSSLREARLRARLVSRAAP
jgi:hypothetical protein